MTIINTLVESNTYDLVADLQALIKQPSVSARKQGLVDCANVVKNIMEKAGIRTELLYLENNDEYNSNKKDKNSSSFVPPIVYGEVKSQANPNAKTILFYNHYDVQPEDPVDLWENRDPFSGKVEGNYIFGRGASDDKGELITRIKAVQYFLKQTGDVPCNIKFLVEGEEEIGSANLERYLKIYKEKFACDAVIWEFGIVDEKDRPIVELGLKGILSVELIATGPLIDVHSSLAVLIENPAWTIVNVLQTLRDRNTGKILIKDWYKEVRDFTKEEIKLLEKEQFDEQAFKKEYGIYRFVNNIQDVQEIKNALAGLPTCNICGLISGYTGEGAKTVLPSKAVAKLDFRLVPDMDPEKQFERLTEYLKENGFDSNGNTLSSGNNATTLKVILIDQEHPARTPIDDPFVRIVEDSAREVFGDVIIGVSSPGTGPMHYFRNLLNDVPCVCIGSTFKFSRFHSPNEFARIDLLNKATKCIGSIIERFDATMAPAAMNYT